jgi:iron-sulfur cluster assembly protein
MIKISDRARAMLKRQGANDESFVRVVVHSGGCAGMTYDAEIDTVKRENEKIVLKDNGIIVITDDDSLPYLRGLAIDYSDDLISAGFRFNNSSNESSCGCGASFSVTGFPVLEKGGVACGT